MMKVRRLLFIAGLLAVPLFTHATSERCVIGSYIVVDKQLMACQTNSAGAVGYTPEINNSRLALFLETHLDNPKIGDVVSRAFDMSTRDLIKFLDNRSANYFYQTRFSAPENDAQKEKALVEFANLYNQIQKHDVRPSTIDFQFPFPHPSSPSQGSTVAP